MFQTSPALETTAIISISETVINNKYFISFSALTKGPRKTLNLPRFRKKETLLSIF